MTFLYFTTIFLFLLTAIVLCAVILMQESKSSGLGASFGGDPTQSLFGTSTADVLRSFTAWAAFFFLLLCLILSLWTASLARSSQTIVPINVEQVD